MGIKKMTTKGKPLVFLSLLLTIGHAKPAQEMSLISETVKDVGAASTSPYWSAQCGDRTYVGTYTLMMDWAECKDYCQYFPHAGDLGHTFQFADIMDSDIMECLRFNMNQQYTPGNEYAGHYWAGGFRGGDGQYRWVSGEPFDFDDFIENPGEEPFIHLTPDNNYSWNSKNDQNDRNNGCLCKSETTTSMAETKESNCPEGWVDLGSKCVHLTYTGMRWGEAVSRCQAFGSELVSWHDKGEYISTKIYIQELAVLHPDLNMLWTTANDIEFEGDWVWGEGPALSFVPTDYGWGGDQPDGNSEADDCGGIGTRDGRLNDMDCGDKALKPLCQIMK